MQAWVDLATRQNYAVLVQQAAVDIASLEAKRNSAGHHPTLDLVASHNYTSQSASQLSVAGSNVTNDSVSLQFSLPLYQGGGVSSREREAAYNLERTRQELENARRSATLVTRQTYLSVINGIAQISALEQALVSSQSALQSNRLGYEVGVRIRSGVNWMREKSRCRAWASVRTRSVLPMPGTPSSRACPPTKRQVSTASTISSWPTTARAIWSRTAL
jgi:outer membrane protein